MNMTYKDFILILGMLCLLMVSTYLVILIKNLNDSIKIFKKVLQDNKDSIDAVMKDAPAISKNMVEITGTVKDELKAVEAAIGNISETIQMTAAAASNIKYGFWGRLKKAIDFLYIAGKLLFKNAKKAGSDKSK